MAPEVAVYAVSDTHLGLREPGPGGHRDAPDVLAGFLRWLASVPPGGVPIPVWVAGQVVERRLQPPTELVLLGDVLELWDSENASVLASAGAIASSLRSIAAKKLYVLGNHDNILATQEGTYPFGVPGLRILGEVYPEPNPVNGSVRPREIGPWRYVFVHGHQFDRSFQDVGRAWTFLGHVRAFGASLGSYAWLFAAWTAAGIALELTLFPSPWGWLLVAGSVLVWFPRFYMTVARRIWNRLTGSRYNRSAAIVGFGRWWRRFQRRLARGGSVGVVYGHTHVLDYVPGRGARAAGSGSPGPSGPASGAPMDPAGTPSPTLYNISSWVRTRGPHSDITWATAFYADADGPLFLGWDWTQARPFHIPFEFVSELRRRTAWSGSPVASALNWPLTMIEKWRQGEHSTL